MRRSLALALIVIAMSVALTGCSEATHHISAHAWVPEACPKPATVAAITGVSLMTFAHAAAHEHSAGGTGCTYQSGASGTQVSVATQPGSPASVIYNTAAGVINTAEPALGSGAHTGTSSFFCGLAVPAIKGRTLTTVILPAAGSRADCAPLGKLLKSVASQQR